MKLTIVVPDSIVIVDGDAAQVDLSQLDFYQVKVLQWDGEKGWLEYHDGRQNTPVLDINLEPFASAVRLHTEAVETRRLFLEEAERARLAADDQAAG